MPVKPFPCAIEAVVTTGIARQRPGRVSCRGTSWKAKLDRTCPVEHVAVGALVEAIARQGNVLVVRPLSSSNI